MDFDESSQPEAPPPGLAVSPYWSLRSPAVRKSSVDDTLGLRAGFKEIGGSGPFEVKWPWLNPADSEGPGCQSGQTEAAWGLRAVLDESVNEQKKDGL